MKGRYADVIIPTKRRMARCVGILCLAFLMLMSSGVAQPLHELLSIQDYTAHRVSSADPSGGNLDMRRINAGDTFTLAELEGPGIITHIWFTHMYNSRSAYRKLVLRIYFDDIEKPCVESPLGDFFGLGNCQTYAYSSMPLAVGTNGGLNSYWLMPFASRARIEVTNDGAQDCRALYFQIDYRKLHEPLPERLYFHAAYRQEFPCEAGKPYIILQTNGGQGHYVGCNVSIEQREPDWWGEGDMRIYVDGETMPSLAGTGMEDDFSGAWCYSHEFSFPNFGAPLRARFNDKGILEHCTPDLRGTELDQWRWPMAWQTGDLWNIYRYHIVDPVPFRSSIIVNQEHGWQNSERADWFSSVAYWYQTGAPSSYTLLPPVEERIPYYLRPHDWGAGRWEGEDFVDMAEFDGGYVEESGMAFWGEWFSGQYLLRWDAREPGNTLTLTFMVEEPGYYAVVARLVKNAEGGIFKVGLDAETGAIEYNLYQPPPFPGPFDVVMAEKELQAGEHELEFVFVGADELSRGKRLLLDKFQVSPPVPVKKKKRFLGIF